MKIPVLIAALLLTACGTVARGPLWQDVEGGVASITWPSPQFGIYTDDQLRVKSVLLGSGADKAGVQVSDILVELTPAGEAEVVSREPVPFTDEEAISQLISEASFFKEEREWLFGPMNYKLVAGPFLLKIQRGDQTIELQIYAENPPSPPNRPGTATPTPTIVPMSFHYF